MKISNDRRALLATVHAANGRGIKVTQEIYGLERAGLLMRDENNRNPKIGPRYLLTFRACAILNVPFVAA